MLLSHGFVKGQAAVFLYLILAVAYAQQLAAAGIYASQVHIGIGEIVVDAVFLAYRHRLREIVVGVFKVQIVAPVEITQIV